MEKSIFNIFYINTYFPIYSNPIVFSLPLNTRAKLAEFGNKINVVQSGTWVWET